jgi:hypothetical protein
MGSAFDLLALVRSLMQYDRDGITLGWVGFWLGLDSSSLCWIFAESVLR